MAKEYPGRKFSFAIYDRKHMKNLLRRAKEISDIFNDATREGARIGETTGYTDPDGEFTFDKFPAAKQRAEELFKELHDQLLLIVTAGNREEWMLSAAKNDAMVQEVFGLIEKQGKLAEAWHEPHLEALEQFNKRKERGMDLSDRVWRLTDQFKGELELALEMGMGDGKSAASLSRDVREYLQEPHRLFRRVRNKKGQLRLSKAAAAYHPGQGMYRSSYKNALRLTATENNIAYRTADHERWNDLDFVIGIEIKLSGNHPVKDICDEMCGVYPKTFKFVGWHPFCRCIAIPKLADEDEFIRRQQALIDGEDVPQGGYSGEVKEMPECFTDWVQANAKRIETAKNQPYFIRDNRAEVDKALRREASGYLQENTRKLEESLAMKAVAEMTFEQANEMRGNPNYKKGVKYRVNCQSSVLANELRRRGFDVEAYGNTKQEWFMPTMLSKKPEIAFMDVNGNLPEVKGIRFNGNLMSSLEGEMKEQGRYHLRFRFNNDNGHIITAERLSDGTLRIYDPQNGKIIKDFSEYAAKVRKDSFEYYRVDNLEINPDVAKGCVKSSGSKGDAPRMKLPQITEFLEKGWLGEEDYYSPKIQSVLSSLREKNKKANYFDELLNDNSFDVDNIDHNGSKTLLHPGHKIKDAYWEETRKMAHALNKSGRNVIFLPEHDNISMADAVTKFMDIPRVVDFKYTASTKFNTLQQHLVEGFKQASAVVLKLENMDAGQFRETIEYIKRNELPIGDVILINKYGKVMELTSKLLRTGSYKNKIKGFLK